jgi:broad specificity phosphatase PhoE
MKLASACCALLTAIDGGDVAIIFLVRHGAHALLDRVLVGCKVDIPLDSIGRQQARALAERFSRERVDIVQSSPRARARQTAGQIAERVGVTLEVAEIDCGKWSGRSFEELASERAWREWNVRRSVSRAPGGESMAEVQRRAVGHIECLRVAHPAGRVVIVSHCDVIRSIVLHYREQSLDAYGEVAIGPATVTTLIFDARGGGVAASGEAATL